MLLIRDVEAVYIVILDHESDCLHLAIQNHSASYRILSALTIVVSELSHHIYLRDYASDAWKLMLMGIHIGLAERATKYVRA